MLLGWLTTLLSTKGELIGQLRWYFDLKKVGKCTNAENVHLLSVCVVRITKIIPTLVNKVTGYYLSKHKKDLIIV